MATTYGEESWSDSQIADMENNMLQGIFSCRTVEAVEAAVTYANFLNKIGLTPENYPVFLTMLEIDNHWVIDALIDKRDPFALLSPVQPNVHIVKRIFAMLARWHKGGIYTKNLSVILGVLQSVYSSPLDGYRIYPPVIADVNAISKHLIKRNGQEDVLNRVLLKILDRFASLEGEGDTNMEEIAIHAAAVRNAFFDSRKKMEDVLPAVLLVREDKRKEIAPRKTVKLSSKSIPDNKTKRTNRKKAA